MAKNSTVSIRQIKSWNAILWVIAGATFFAAYLPVLTGLVRVWAHSDDYSHGFVIIPLAVYILWQKREALFNAPVRGARSGLLVAAASLFAYVVAQKGEIQTVAAVSVIFFIWGAVIFLFGYPIFKACLFPLLILFFMIPVPAQVMAALTIPLQLLVTRASVWLASMIGIPIFHEGNVIHLAQGTFQVVQACSGLRSIMTMLTLGAVLAYFTLRSNAFRGVLFFLAIPIAIVVNILRVFILIAVFHFLEIDLSEGTLHTILGVVVFGLAFGIFLLTGKGLALCER